MMTCKRPGCGRKLRGQNKKGVCATGCLSPEAPPSVRAKHILGAEPKTMHSVKAVPRDAQKILENFRIVTAAMGKDPDAILAEAAEEWLAVVRAAIDKLDSAEATS